MKKRVRFVIGFATLVAAGCTVRVNGEVHKFGVGGEEEKKKPDGQNGAAAGGQAGGDASKADALAAELAGGTTPAGQSVTLKSDFAPNPTVVGTFSSKGEVSIGGKEHGVSRCSGYVGQQAAAVIKFTSPMKNTRISAPGAKLILAEFGDRQYTCNDESYGDRAPSVMLDEWPGSEITIFVGGRQDETYNYELRVEDEKRPVDILWKDKVTATEIAELPKDPLILTQTTPTTAGRQGSRCGKGYFREVPDVVFSLKRPLGDMSIEVKSAKAIDVEIVGPLNDTGRNLPTQCGTDDNRLRFNRMEAGLYGLRIGTDKSGDEALYHVVVRSKDTTRNPTQPPSKFADKIALDESVVVWHYPQLTVEDLETSDANREAIFLSAPKELFVFPKFNLDKSVAQIIGDGGSSREKGAPAPEYPKESEPLLLLSSRNGGVVMAADGTMYRVNMKDLQADPNGAVTVSGTPRNTYMSFDQAVRAKGPEDEKAYAAWQKAEKDVKTCSDRARNNVEATFESLCSSVQKAADKKKEALEKELTKNRVARRAASLGKVKTRVEGLFKK